MSGSEIAHEVVRFVAYAVGLSLLLYRGWTWAEIVGVVFVMFGLEK